MFEHWYFWDILIFMQVMSMQIITIQKCSWLTLTLKFDVLSLKPINYIEVNNFKLDDRLIYSNTKG